MTEDDGYTTIHATGVKDLEGDEWAIGSVIVRPSEVIREPEKGEWVFRVEGEEVPPEDFVKRISAEARNEALEEAAREVDCDCKYRDTVIAVSRKKSGNACRYAPCCGALAAVAIRALKDTPEGDT